MLLPTESSSVSDITFGHCCNGAACSRFPFAGTCLFKVLLILFQVTLRLLNQVFQVGDGHRVQVVDFPLNFFQDVGKLGLAFFNHQKGRCNFRREAR